MSVMSAQQHQRAAAPGEQRQQEYVEEPEQTVAEGEGEEQVQQADETASKNEEEESKIVDGGGE